MTQILDPIVVENAAAGTETLAAFRDTASTVKTPAHLEDATQRQALLTALELLGADATLQEILQALQPLATALAITAQALPLPAGAATDAKLELVRALLAGGGQITAVGGQAATLSQGILTGQSMPASGLDLGTGRLARIDMPASWTPADLTLQVSATGSQNSFQNLYDSFGNEYVIKAAAGRSILLPYADFIGINHVMFRSGTSSVPVAQAQNSILTLTTVP